MFGGKFPIFPSLSGVTYIKPSGFAFAALRSDGRVVSWGDPSFGGYSKHVQKDLLETCAEGLR